MKKENIGIDQFVSAVAKRAKTSQNKTKNFINELFSKIGDHLEEEDRVPIHRFGVFKKTWTEKRKGRNPQTGKPMDIPAQYRISFSPSSQLAEKVNRKYRRLKPNVLDEMLNMTGIKKETEEEAFEKKGRETKELKAQKKQVRKRAVITLIVLFTLVLTFLTTVVLVPVYYVNEHNKVVAFVTSLNEMMGLSGLSGRIHEGLEEEIDEEKAGAFLKESREELFSAGDRELITTYEIKEGDTIFELAERFWGDEHLWPDLYITNKEEFADPDLIHPGEKIEVYEPLGADGGLSRKERDTLVQAYIGVYRIYRALGEEEIKSGETAKGERRKEDAVWVLYVAAGYDHKLPKKYVGAIYPSDLEKLEGYIDRFGYLEIEG